MRAYRDTSYTNGCSEQNSADRRRECSSRRWGSTRTETQGLELPDPGGVPGPPEQVLHRADWGGGGRAASSGQSAGER